MRRELAARIAVDLATADDLDPVLATAVTGFTVLFDGAVTLRVAPTKGTPVVLSPRGRVPVDELDPVRAAGARVIASTATTCSSARSGKASCSCPTAQRSDCRAWVQFDEPRLVSSDELIVGDLLAQTLGQAVDRVVAQQRARRRSASSSRPSRATGSSVTPWASSSSATASPRPGLRDVAAGVAQPQHQAARDRHQDDRVGARSRERLTRVARLLRLRPWSRASAPLSRTGTSPTDIADELRRAGFDKVQSRIREALSGEDDS